MTNTDDTLSIRRRQLAFRAWHRGTREADLLLGRFADVYLPAAHETEVEAFAHLLTAEDPDLWDWITNRKPVDPAFNNSAYQALVAFIPPAS